MRPETKEGADTAVGSLLRGSFTFYQATAGDVEEGGMKRGGRGGGCFQFVSGAEAIPPLFSCFGLHQPKEVINESDWRRERFYRVVAAVSSGLQVLRYSGPVPAAPCEEEEEDLTTDQLTG